VKAVWYLAQLTLLEARRRRTFLAGVLLSVLFLGGIVTLTTVAERASANASPPARPNEPTGSEEAQERREQRRQRFEHQIATSAIRTGGMWVIRTFATLMAIVLAAGSIAPEKESGVLHTIVTKPISRVSVLAGKWVGLNLLLFVYLVAMGGLLVIVLAVRSGDFPWDVLRASAVSLLFPLLFVTLGVLFSTWTSVWVGMGAGLFAWIVGAQEYGFVRIVAVGLRGIGNEAAADVLEVAGRIAGYLVPTGRIGLWVDRLGGSTQFMLSPPIIERPTASLWDLGYVFVYVLGTFALACWRFRRLDL